MLDMESESWNAVRSIKNLLNRIDASEILDELLVNKVLTLDDVSKIQQKETKSDRNNMLLDILQHYNCDDKYNKFVEVSYRLEVKTKNKKESDIVMHDTKNVKQEKTQEQSCSNQNETLKKTDISIYETIPSNPFERLIGTHEKLDGKLDQFLNLYLTAKDDYFGIIAQQKALILKIDDLAQKQTLKNEIRDSYAKFTDGIHVKFGQEVKTLLTDNGNELKSITGLLSDNGIGLKSITGLLSDNLQKLQEENKAINERYIQALQRELRNAKEETKRLIESETNQSKDVLKQLMPEFTSIRSALEDSKKSKNPVNWIIFLVYVALWILALFVISYFIDIKATIPQTIFSIFFAGLVVVLNNGNSTELMKMICKICSPGKNK